MTAATVSVSTHRDRLLEFLRAGRFYEFLNGADPYLQVVPDDDYIRLMAVREYLSLGLVPPAKELLFVDPAVCVLPPQLVALREHTDALSAATIPWSLFQGTFDANLAALDARDAAFGAIRDSQTELQENFELLRDRHGVYQVRQRLSNGARQWLPYLGNHGRVDDARALPDAIGTAMPGPYLFEGMGMGRFFERVYQATKDTFLGYSCALYVIEPEPAFLAVVLHLADWREILSDRRVMLFVGKEWQQRLLQAWESDPDLPLPCQAFTCGRSSVGADRAVHQAAEARSRAVRASYDELEQRYASRTIAFWAHRFEEALGNNGPPLRILAAVSTHTTFLQHSMRDAKRALEALGHQCVVLTESTPYTTTSPRTFHRAIREMDPDLFFVLDHLRPEFESIIPSHLPILTWDQDQLPHVVTRANLQRIARHDFLVGCSKSHCLSHGCDPRQILHARVPTCPAQFGGDDLTDEELARWTCDVSYVSHASQTPQAFHEQERKGFDHPQLSRLLDVMYERLPELLRRYRTVDGGVMSAVLGAACRDVGITRLDADLEERLRSWYLWRLGDRIFRHEALEWVAEWARRSGQGFRIYGNGWQTHPTLSDFAAGPVSNGRELLCVYRASKINLQLMPAGFIHQRSLDGLAAGGFFLTRLCPHDLRGRTLRRLDRRIRELGIQSTADLLASQDSAMAGLLRDYMGDWLGRMDHVKYDLLQNIQLNAELLFPDEVFGDFSGIVFDISLEFEALADRFLSNESARRATATRMRQIVVDKFSYKAAMSHFLKAMAAYLHAVASEATANTSSPH